MSAETQSPAEGAGVADPTSFGDFDPSPEELVVAFCNSDAGIRWSVEHALRDAGFKMDTG